MRSLQRHLEEQGTSFRGELVQARVRAAQVMLLETTDSIDSIARALGFKATGAFTTMFGRTVGVSPAEFRRRRG